MPNPLPKLLVREDDPAEAAYWEFDARRSGNGQWRGMPMSERDAFKAVARKLLAEAYATAGTIKQQALDRSGASGEFPGDHD